MKEQKRIVFPIGDSQELPCVHNSKVETPYARKNKNPNKVQGNPHEADRIRARYMKLCKQAKKSFNSVQNKKSTGNLQQYNRIGIREEGKIDKVKFCRITSVRKSPTQASEEPPQEISPFAMALESLQVQGRKTNKDTSLGISPVFKGKRLKPITNFLMKRMETDYLNIGKAKMEIKTRTQKEKKILIREDSNGGNQSCVSNYPQTSFKIERHPSNTDHTNSMTQSMELPNKKIEEKISAVVAKPAKQPPARKPKPFVIPFQTYNYRDLIWKVGFSNGQIFPPPLEYEHRLKVFIGKGNNGGLIRGLVKRRIWFAITDRLEDANFVWTQLKVLSYFGLQKKQQACSQSRKDDKISGRGILTCEEQSAFKNYIATNSNSEERQDQKMQHRQKWFTQSRKKQQNPEEEEEGRKQVNIKQNKKMYKGVEQIREQRLHNHFVNNYIIGNKKTLFQTMSLYYKHQNDYVFNHLPCTYHVQAGLEDEQFLRFLRFYYQRGKDIRNETPKSEKMEENVWIVKPGENSNRGMGIRVCKTLEDIKAIVKQKEKNMDGSDRTFIIQMYIEKPLLYNRRKFDLRHYMMVTSVNGVLKGYWYRDGYVRTTSSEYSLNTKEGRVHLTNDAIQKQLPDYGKYEKGNKISYDDLHLYLNRHYGYKNYNFKEIILPKMKKMGTDIIKASSGALDPHLHSNNFEIFGLDFMIDADFNLWLIEVNTNPCLEISCPLLGTIIPKMIENALELTLDPLFPPPIRYCPKGVHYFKKLEDQNRFDLVYDSRVDGIYKQSSNALDARLLNEEDDTYEDEGEEWNEDD